MPVHLLGCPGSVCSIFIRCPNTNCRKKPLACFNNKCCSSDHLICMAWAHSFPARFPGTTEIRWADLMGHPDLQVLAGSQRSRSCAWWRNARPARSTCSTIWNMTAKPWCQNIGATLSAMAAAHCRPIVSAMTILILGQSTAGQPAPMPSLQTGCAWAPGDAWLLRSWVQPLNLASLRGKPA